MKTHTSSTVIRRALFATAALLAASVFAPCQAAERTVSFANGAKGYKSTVESQIQQGEGVVDRGIINVRFGVTDRGTDKETAMQVLLRFDDIFGNKSSQIPAGATITKAVLRIAVGRNEAFVSGNPSNLNRILVPWDAKAAWRYKSWGKSGIKLDDRIAVKTPDASVTFDRNNFVYNIDVTKSLQAWAKGEPNHGWVFTMADDQPGAPGFVSSRVPNPPQRPRLTVTYRTGAAPAPKSASAAVGKILPPWSEGHLDIHHINTGLGESTFFIFPDGTTMLIDAGVTNTPPISNAPAMPNGERTPGEWIARYIDRALKPAPKKIINYAMISHYHDDHMGFVGENTKKSALGGNYLASGITEVADYIPYQKIIDRAWPEMTGPAWKSSTWHTLKISNYKKFIEWQQKNRGLKMERFKVGVKDQIVLLNKPAKYPEFEIRNLAAGGIVWTGEGVGTHNVFEGGNVKEISENMCSIAIRIDYGPFKYYTGGDLDGADNAEAAPQDTWRNIETPVAKVTGHVNAMKANHHAVHNANSLNFLRILSPRVFVAQTWDRHQWSSNVVSRLRNPLVYPGPKTLLPTNTAFAWYDSPTSAPCSHVVIRVAPGGKEYFAYRISCEDESGTILRSYGPLQSD